MIVRTWHGCVPREHAEGFAAHLDLTGVRHSRGIEGNKGAFVKRVTQGNWEHFSLQHIGKILRRLKLSRVTTTMWLSPTSTMINFFYCQIHMFSSMK